jgi:hypothetical protein
VKEYFLVGAEQVERAARSIQSSAEQMAQVAMNIDGALEAHSRRMDQWLQEFSVQIDRLEALRGSQEKGG